MLVRLRKHLTTEERDDSPWPQRPTIREFHPLPAELAEAAEEVGRSGKLISTSQARDILSVNVKVRERLVYRRRTAKSSVAICFLFSVTKKSAVGILLR